MLGQNHFAEPNHQHVFDFSSSKIYCTLVEELLLELVSLQASDKNTCSSCVTAATAASAAL
jgi:alkylhydroperoxidase family enzyme